MCAISIKCIVVLSTFSMNAVISMPQCGWIARSLKLKRNVDYYFINHISISMRLKARRIHKDGLANEGQDLEIWDVNKGWRFIYYFESEVILGSRESWGIPSIMNAVIVKVSVHLHGYSCVCHTKLEHDEQIELNGKQLFELKLINL